MRRCCISAALVLHASTKHECIEQKYEASLLYVAAAFVLHASAAWAACISSVGCMHQQRGLHASAAWAACIDSVGCMHQHPPRLLTLTLTLTLTVTGALAAIDIYQEYEP